MPAVTRFPAQGKKQPPQQPGEKGRLHVLQGPDRGTTYVIFSFPFTIGRAEDCDVVLSDLKTSRRHAEGIFQQGRSFLKDDQSANGIYVEGKRQPSIRLESGTVIALGETVLEWKTAHKAPKEGLSRVSLAFVFTALIMFFLWEDDPVSTSSKQKMQKTIGEGAERQLASFLPMTGTVLPEVDREVQLLFNLGRREYFLGNYNRARANFETVLQMNPAHDLAQIYLQNCLQSVEEDVKSHLEYGKKSFEAGKKKEAVAHFIRVIRLLERDQTNPFWVEAQEQLKKMSEESLR